jgi:hypothetical protein
MKKTKRIRFLFIAFGVVLVWRGFWGIADLYIFPENPLISFLVSIGLGLVILLASKEKFSDLF